jgi:hypothetical protein
MAKVQMNVKAQSSNKGRRRANFKDRSALFGILILTFELIPYALSIFLYRTGRGKSSFEFRLP